MHKLVLQRLLSAPAVALLWSPLTAGRVAIFTLHRFAMPGLRVPGHGPAELRRSLARLRRERYTVLGLADAVRRLREGALPRRAVAFTVDDGYRDFAEVGADLFLEHDFPVTVFLATGFVDGTGWLWWDQIAHVLAETRRPVLELRHPEGVERVEVPGPALRLAAAQALAVRWSTLPDDALRHRIAELARAGEVSLPRAAPEAYRALSWSDARRLEARGIDFGPHTVTHPILTRTDDAQSRLEITASWERVREELRAPVPVFSYPNGDAGPREMETVRRLGLAGAVTTEARYADARGSAGPGGALTRIPRFPYLESATHTCLTASGFGRVAAGVRKLHHSVLADHAA